MSSTLEVSQPFAADVSGLSRDDLIHLSGRMAEQIEFLNSRVKHLESISETLRKRKSMTVEPHDLGEELLRAMMKGGSATPTILDANITWEAFIPGTFEFEWVGVRYRIALISSKYKIERVCDDDRR